LGERLRALREASGLSQRELADKAGVAISIVCQIEQGRRRQDPRFSTVARIARALGVSLDAFLPPGEPAKHKGGREPRR
jgi:transcriptional regulator with XRE-family HTH domain